MSSADPMHASSGAPGPVSAGERTERWDASGARPNTPRGLEFLEASSKPGVLGRLLHYEVLEVIGSGGFGVVLKAQDEKLQRTVALKVLATHGADDAVVRKRFLREARAAAGLTSPNVVHVYAVEEAPVAFLVMEYVAGQTLQQRLEQGRLPLEEVLRIGQQIAVGLAAAHALGLIHRDIKPSNVLLEAGSQRAKISDFGLAKAIDETGVTQTGIIAGTPLYMSPEQADDGAVDARADLFSLGSVLYAMCTGVAPFAAPSTVAVLKRVCEEEPRPIRELNAAIPEWLCDIIARLQAKKPADRFETAQEVSELLARGLTITQAGGAMPRLPRTSPPRRRAWLRYAAAAAVVAVAVAWFIWPRPLPDGPKPPEAPPLAPRPTSFTNRLGMELVLVPQGKAWLGGGGGSAGEREVTIAADFYLGKYEVTQEEWHKVMGANPSHFQRDGGGKEAVKDIADDDLKRFPVEQVSWHDVQRFLQRLNEAEPTPGWTYRLPTGIEWEYACRGGAMAGPADGRFHIYAPRPQNQLAAMDANFNSILGRTAKVGSYAPNRLGLYDMHGNVWEWSADAGTASYGSGWYVWGGCWKEHAGTCYASSHHVYNGRSRLRGVRVCSSGP